MSNVIGLEDQEILAALKTAYAPDGGDVREHNGDEHNLGFGLVHYALVRNLQPDYALAIGSRYGFVPACIALAAKANRKGRLHFVDANYNDQTDRFAKAYGGTGHWNKPIQELFGRLGLHEWIDLFIERTDTFFPRSQIKYGYIYIDGNHSYEGVKYDCEQAIDHLLPGGIIAFHDALVDQSFVDQLADPAGFGIKDYLQERFPNALVLHRWPGLAAVQPFPLQTEKSPASKQPPPGQQARAPENSTSDHLNGQDQLMHLTRLICKHTELQSRLNELEIQMKATAAENEELHKCVARQQEQIRGLLTKAESLEHLKTELQETVLNVSSQLREHDEYLELIARIRRVVRDLLPERAKVLVVSKGDDQLLDLGSQDGWHFPQVDTGTYSGDHPADSAEAIAGLENLRHYGAQFLLFPRTSFWWLDAYPDFKLHLERRYRILHREEDTCLIFSLLEPIAGENHRS